MLERFISTHALFEKCLFSVRFDLSQGLTCAGLEFGNLVLVTGLLGLSLRSSLRQRPFKFSLGPGSLLGHFISTHALFEKCLFSVRFDLGQDLICVGLEFGCLLFITSLHGLGLGTGPRQCPIKFVLNAVVLLRSLISTGLECSDLLLITDLLGLGLGPSL